MLFKVLFLQTLSRLEVNFSLLQMGVKCSTTFILSTKKDEIDGTDESYMKSHAPRCSLGVVFGMLCLK